MKLKLILPIRLTTQMILRHWLLLRHLFTLLLAITIGLLFLSLYFINIYGINPNGLSSSTSIRTESDHHSILAFIDNSVEQQQQQQQRQQQEQEDDPWWQWFCPKLSDNDQQQQQQQPLLQQTNQSIYFATDDDDGGGGGGDDNNNNEITIDSRYTIMAKQVDAMMAIRQKKRFRFIHKRLDSMLNKVNETFCLSL